MASSTGREQAVRSRLPAARRDRRPALAALAILLILLGALGSALIAFRTGEKVSVLVASQAIPVGTKVEASDFASIRVASNSDPGCTGGSRCSFIPSDLLKRFVGSRAATSIPAGAVLTQSQFSRERPIPNGSELIGIQVSTSQRTSSVPAPGDVVALRCAAGSNDADVNCDPDTALVDAARVVAVGSGDTSDVSNVTVLVSSTAAGKVVSLASSGNVAMTLLPDDTKPSPDLVTPGS